MISNAGRTVCAVVCVAPDTMPSTMSLCTSMVPKYETSWMISRACSTVTPLCLRSSAYCSANWSHSSLVRGLSTVRCRQVDAEFGCAGADLRLVAEDGQLGDIALQQPARRLEDAVVLALGQHDALAVRSRPVQQLVGEHLRGDDRRDRNRQLRKQIRGVDVGVHQLDRGVDLALRARGDPAARRRRPCWPSRRCRSVVAMIGSRRPRPDTSAAIDGCSSQPAVEDDARQRRKAFGRMGAHHREHHVGAVARRDDGDAVGQPFQHVLGGHARDQHVHHLAVEQLGVAADQRAFDGVAAARPPTARPAAAPRAARRTSARMRFSASATAAICDGSQRLATTAAVWACWPAISTRHSSTTWATSVGVRSLALHRQHDRRAEVGRDAGVDVQLARRGDVGVVAADDHHRVALVGHLVVAVDDVGDAPRRDHRAAAGS